MKPKIVESNDLSEIINAEPISLDPQLLTNESAMALQKSYVQNYYETEPDGDFLPLWTIVTGNNYMVPTVTPWRSDEEKRFFINHLRDVMAKLSAKRFIFTSECWVATMSKNDTKTLAALENGEIKVSDLENRKEILTIIVGDKNTTIASGFFIHRNWETNHVERLEDMGESIGEPDGLLANML